MIREHAPVGLIPAAWAMTFATLLLGLDTYWIQHMHYFMILFLAGFTVLSWKEMSENPVLDIWSKIIAAGAVFTAIGTLAFFTEYTALFGWISITYWFLAPGLGLYLSSKHMDKYSGLYEELALTSLVSFTLFTIGASYNYVNLEVIGLVGTAAGQTTSMLAASKLDSS
jgi:hypothetical protein